MISSPGRRITIKDVAREAGVSVQTVSRVVNEQTDVAPDTRLRVSAVIERLDYHPNAVARTLSRRRSHLLGVVAGSLEYYGPSRTVVGIERQAAELGYSVLFALLREPDAEALDGVVRNLLAQKVEGIVWYAPEVGAQRAWWERIRPWVNVPFLALSTQPAPGLSVMAVDNRHGGRLAVEHLLANGYRHIGLVAGPQSWWEAAERRAGWHDALLAAGLAPDERQIYPGDWSPASGAAAVLALRTRFPEMNGLFAANDQMALGALRAAQVHGLRVPDDLAIVGFDDRPEAAYYTPPLTTIRQQMFELGGLAVRELHRMVQAARQNRPLESNDTLLVQPQLIVRESSARRGGE